VSPFAWVPLALPVPFPELSEESNDSRFGATAGLSSSEESRLGEPGTVFVISRRLGRLGATAGLPSSEDSRWGEPDTDFVISRRLGRSAKARGFRFTDQPGSSLSADLK
ncbi:MAG: hypothetical protein ACOY3P_22275, partial [Planctomycetota bacterium]